MGKTKVLVWNQGQPHGRSENLLWKTPTSTSFPVTEHTRSMLPSCSSGDSFPYSYTGVWYCLPRVSSYVKLESSSPELGEHVPDNTY